MVTGDAKWGAFFASEAFILPSHQENFGIAVAEALACGKPVLLADKVNIAEDIAEDGAGLMEMDTADGTLQLLERWIAMSPARANGDGGTGEQCFIGDTICERTPRPSSGCLRPPRSRSQVAALKE